MTEPDWSSCSEEAFWEYVAWHLKSRGIDTVLVGGAVVAIYTEGLYRSGDIDLIPDDFDRDRIAAVLEEIGFGRSGRHYCHPECNHLFVEFSTGPVSLGSDYRITPAKREVAGQTIRLLAPTDCVKDRLASYIHWKTRDCLEQAVLVAQRQEVDLNAIESWCKAEGGESAFEEFSSAVAAGS